MWRRRYDVRCRTQPIGGDHDHLRRLPAAMIVARAKYKDQVDDVTPSHSGGAAEVPITHSEESEMTREAKCGTWRSMRWMVLLLAWMLAASVLIPSVAVADEDDGLQALRSANDAFEEENFEAAYDYYDKAYEILDEEKIKYRLGQTAEQLGWAKKAVDHYERYREIGDDEEFLGRIDDAMPELREQLQVTVEVISDPEGAMVTVVEPAGEYDEEPTPATLTLEAGDVEVAISLEGYEDAIFEETLVVGEEYTWEATLEEKSDEEVDTIAELGDVDDAEGTLSTWGLTTTGVGVSLLAFGGVMSVFQTRTTDEVNELDRAAMGAETESFEDRERIRQEQQDLRDDAQTYYRLSTGAFIAGGVLTAAGAGLLLHGALGSTDDGEGLSIHGGVSSEGGIVGVGGRF